MQTSAGQKDWMLWRIASGDVEGTQMEAGDRNVVLSETTRHLPVTALNIPMCFGSRRCIRRNRTRCLHGMTYLCEFSIVPSGSAILNGRTLKSCP
jgi:hypothetical protein